LYYVEVEESQLGFPCRRRLPLGELCWRILPCKRIWGICLSVWPLDW